jgi:single-stranded-DNA-specific exonuclease
MASRPEYSIVEALSEEIEAALALYTPLTRRLLANRGITTADAAHIFLNPDYDTHLHDPFLFTDMEKAVGRVLEAMAKNEHIVIYTDYDCDGIPGGVVLHDFFEAIQYTNFENYIPHRHHEGYGFNAAAVPQFHERGATLIITVDCGIVDHEAALAAKALGIDVIITDHHEPSETLPDAFAVVNPKRDDAYPFKGICGAGVAYKLACAVLIRGREQGTITLKEGMEKWWLDMVGIATIADMVPLQDENRALARYGLSVLRKSRRPGLQQLLRKAGGSQQHLTEDDIGFTIAPRINAASRMDTPEDAFHMLRTKDEGEAGARVLHLEKLNLERKGVVASMTKEAKKRLHAQDEIPAVIVMGNPEWRPSLVGLVANALTEEFKRPAFLWGRDGKDVIKGSCRSEGVTSTLKLMEAVPEAFLGFGGHHASGGFSVADDKIHTLVETLNNAFVELGNERMAEGDSVHVDADLLLSDITYDLMRTLASLAPYGQGNPKPVFRFKDIVPVRVDIFGKAKDHTKLRFEHERGTQEAIAFFKTPDQFDVVPEAGKPLTLIAHVEESFFMGRKETRLRIIDIL